MGLRLANRAKKWSLGLGIVAMSLFISGCSAETKAEWKRLANPVPSTKEAEYMQDMWVWSWVAAMAVGVVVWALIFYVIIRYRRRSDDEVPVQTRYHLPIEVFYTVAPIMMVIVFFYFTVVVQDKVINQAAEATPAHNITVVGSKWSWAFNYVDEEAIDGGTVHEGGTTGVRPTLWLEKDVPTKFTLHSPDVIHSFWVPAFLFKMDVIPGRDNTFQITPTREGTFIGRCAELCGELHTRMLFDVKVVDGDAYDAHLEDLQEIDTSQGLNLGGSDIDKPEIEEDGGAE